MGERVFGLAFERRRDHEKRRFKPRLLRNEPHDGGLPGRDRPGLVENDVRGVAEVLQRRRVLEENPAAGARTRRDHHGRGGGEPQGARTRNDEDRDGVRERDLEGRTDQKPDGQGKERDADHEGHEDGAHLVGKARDRRFGGGRFVHHADDLRQNRFVPDAGRAGGHVAGRDEGRAQHRVALGLFLRTALTRHRGFVEGARAREDHAVDGDGGAGAKHQDVARNHVVAVDEGFLPVLQDHRRGRRELQQSRHGFRGLPLGAGFQVFPDRDQRHDHRGAFEVEAVREVGDHFLVTETQRVRHREDHPEAVEKRRARADRDQRIHVRGAHPERLEAADEEPALEEEDRDREEELQERRNQAVFGVAEPEGERHAHHGAHRNRKERDQQNDRRDEPTVVGLKRFGGFRVGVDRRGGVPGGARRGVRAGDAVARALDRTDDVGPEGRGVRTGRRGDAHRILEEVHRHGVDAVDFRDGALDPRRAGGAGHAGDRHAERFGLGGGDGANRFRLGGCFGGGDGGVRRGRRGDGLVLLVHQVLRLSVENGSCLEG